MNDHTEMPAAEPVEPLEIHVVRGAVETPTLDLGFHGIRPQHAQAAGAVLLARVTATGSTAEVWVRGTDAATARRVLHALAASRQKSADQGLPVANVYHLEEAVCAR